MEELIKDMNETKKTNNDIDRLGYRTLNITDSGDLSLPKIDSIFKLSGSELHLDDNNGAEWQFGAELVETDSNTFGVLFGGKDNPYVYRGQHYDYPKMVSSAFRFNYENENDTLKHCVDWIKKQEFFEILKNTPYVERSEEFKVLRLRFNLDYEALAQHYEFISNYVDVTRNLFIALFFAYTYQKNGNYLPITDFDGYEPTLYVGNLAKINQQLPGSLKAISFEILPRPSAQQAMAIEAKKVDIKPLFQSYKLPKSPSVACEVFRWLKDGRDLFPPADYMGKVAKKIKSDTHLSFRFLKMYCGLKGIAIDEILKGLQTYGYEVCSDIKWEISPGEIHDMDSTIDNAIQWVRNRVDINPVSKMS